MLYIMIALGRCAKLCVRTLSRVELMLVVAAAEDTFLLVPRLLESVCRAGDRNARAVKFRERFVAPSLGAWKLRRLRPTKNAGQSITCLSIKHW